MSPEEIDAIADVLDDDTASTITQIIPDERRGHIALLGSDGRTVAFADLGSVLHLWSGQGCYLTPDVADELAGALTAWATRKRVAAGVVQEQLDTLAGLVDAWEDGRLKGQSLVDALKAVHDADPALVALLGPSRRDLAEAMADAWRDVSAPPAEHGYFDQRGNWVTTGVW